jgi:hypothetical protein
VGGLALTTSVYGDVLSNKRNLKLRTVLVDMWPNFVNMTERSVEGMRFVSSGSNTVGSQQSAPGGRSPPSRRSSLIGKNGSPVRLSAMRYPGDFHGTNNISELIF